MTADPNATPPGGFTSGREALEALAASSQQGLAYETHRQRLNHALTNITMAISAAGQRRNDAIRAIAYFSQHDPASLGILWPDPALETHLEDASLKLEDVLGDVKAILRNPGGRA